MKNMSFYIHTVAIENKKDKKGQNQQADRLRQYIMAFGWLIIYDILYAYRGGTSIHRNHSRL